MLSVMHTSMMVLDANIVMMVGCTSSAIVTLSSRAPTEDRKYREVVKGRHTIDRSCRSQAGMWWYHHRQKTEEEVMLEKVAR